MKKIKVGIVNYLNTLPLLYGIKNTAAINDIELIEDYPVNIAIALQHGKIDIGLIPVAVIPELPSYHIQTDYCIGCNGPVGSVCLFSEVPLHEVEFVMMDYHSRTSVELAKLMLNDHWKVNPELIYPGEEYLDSIKGTTAGLVIGDRSFVQRTRSPYIYDLGEAWKQHTGLPFVFAAWISIKELDESFVHTFNKANKYGVNNISTVIDQNHFPLFDLHQYFSKYISYEFDAAKKKGLDKFLNMIGDRAWRDQKKKF